MAKSEGPTYDDLVSLLAKKDFSPIYLLYGEEDFLIEEATDAIVNAALSKEERGFNLDVMYGSEADARDVVSHASSFPMMAERRVVLVREADKLNGEILGGYLDSPSPSTCLVLVCAKPDFRKKPFSSIKKKAFVLECKPLWDNQVPSWITRRAKKEKYEIQPDAAQMLAAYVGTSLREISNELEKLYIYIGERKSISVDDVTAVVGVSKEFSVFELQWAIGSRDTRKATEILERMIEAGESAIMMVTMLTRFFQTLYKLHDAKRRGATGQQLYIQSGIFSFNDRWSNAASNFSIRDIEDAFLALSIVDENLKLSGDPKLLMQTFIVNATRREEPSYA